MNKSYGQCKLCLSTGELRNSHFIPKSAYKLIQQSEAAPPIAVRPTLTIQTNDQMKDYLFCAACEDRLNKNGEAWVMKYCSRNAEGFRLKELLDAAEPVASNGLKVYSASEIPEIDIEKLAYFAVSVFWRGAIHYWSFGKQKIKRLYLGSYTEELRRYLLKEEEVPKHSVIWISVITEPKLWNSFVAPYGERLEQCYRYKFHFLGISFMLFLGKLINTQFRSMCTLRSASRLLYSGEPANEVVIEDLGRVIRKSALAGSLKEHQPRI